ncbi:MAG: septum formation initiator family protein [Desulfuromonas sp.]|nr:septum formation initiator family protein [Desulfuromonas thiophila]
MALAAGGDEKHNRPPAVGRSCYLFWAGLVIVGLLLALGGDKGALRLYRTHQYQAQLGQELAQLQQRQQQLRLQLQALRSDDRYLEQVARGDLCLVREGEIVYQFAAPKR